MAIRTFFQKWGLGLILLAALALCLALGAARLLRARDVSTTLMGVEVVTAHPLKAIHMMSGRAPVDMGTGIDSETAANAEARVEVPVSFYDFGSISAQAVVRRDFLVINRGSAPLVVRQAFTTCGCTTAELSASVIPPGKASRATVIFDAGFHPVAGQTVRRGLILETNDPARPEVEIWVQAAVR